MSGSLHILLIDGNSKDRSFYVDALKTASPDYMIYEAASGYDGLKSYYSHAVDCVILELELPDMSGFAVLASLLPLTQHQDIPIIILTRLNFMSLIELAVLNGASIGLYKDAASLDLLNAAIVKATSAIRADDKRAVFTVGPSTLEQAA